MKIGIISDTHLKEGKMMKALIDKTFDEVDIIVHAGDFNSVEVVEALQSTGKFVGVYGNVDDDSVKCLLKEKEIFSVDKNKIGVFHGHGNGGNTLERAYEKFIDDSVDIIIFGHSHQPLMKTINGVLMLNPGSFTSKRKERWYSYLILELNEDVIDVHFKFQSKIK